jgi:hypothetical protein
MEWATGFGQQIRNFFWRAMVQILLFLFCFFHASAIELFDSNNVSSSLQKAHKAYLETDFGTLAHAVRTVLSTGNENAGERKNAMELFSKACRMLGSSSFPVQWNTESVNVEDLSLMIQRIMSLDSTETVLNLSGHFQESGNQDYGVKVLKFPDTVLMDSLHGVGQWNTDADGHFSLRHSFNKVLDEGVYLVEFYKKTRKIGDGWFLLSSLNSGKFRDESIRASSFSTDSEQEFRVKIQTGEGVTSEWFFSSGARDKGMEFKQLKQAPLELYKEALRKDILQMGHHGDGNEQNGSSDSSTRVIRLKRYYSFGFGPLKIMREVISEVPME